VQRLANMLEVDGSVQARANALVEEVELRRNSTERAPKSELTTAGCLFIASREGEVPLTIINVALAAGVSDASLAKRSRHACGVTVLLSRDGQAKWSCFRHSSPLQVPAYTLGCAVSAIARSCELMVPQPQVPKFIYRTVCALEQLQAVQVCLRRTQHAQTLRSEPLSSVADSPGRAAGDGPSRCCAAA